MIKKIIKHFLFKKSVKEMELDRILDKISNKKYLTNREINFLKLYQLTNDDICKDYLYLSRNSAFVKITELLELNKVVICKLHDKNGEIGFKIIKIENNYEKDSCIIYMNNCNCEITDKFLYHIKYNINKDEYSIQEQDEYFEKIISNL